METKNKQKTLKEKILGIIAETLIGLGGSGLTYEAGNAIYNSKMIEQGKQEVLYQDRIFGDKYSTEQLRARMLGQLSALAFCSGCLTYVGNKEYHKRQREKLEGG